MKTSIATVSLSGDLADKVAAIARAGFDGVEIFEQDFIAFDHSPRDVGRMVRDSGMAVALFQPFRDFEGLPEPFRAKSFDRAERKFDVMGELGADLVLVCSNASPHALGGVDRAAADLRALGERAARRGIRVGYEALAWGRFVSDHRDAWEIVRRADHPAVGLILDSFHTLARGLDPDTIRSIPADRVFFVQLADAPRLSMDLLSWSRHHRCMPGQGDLPVGAFVEAVQATGYDGYLSLEVFNDLFRAAPAGAVAVDGRRSLIAVADRGARPALPPRPATAGVEFVEFAADAAAGARLAGTFRALGFSRTARHRTKRVDLWSQGGARLVLNAEPHGFAAASFNARGPGVCALCFRVDDARAASERAVALLATPFRQDVEPGQLLIPAVRGVGGSLLYFVDGAGDLGRLWEVDFEPAEAEAGGAGLSAIDHVAQSMEDDEMLSWLLFYSTVLDLAKSPGQDIADPGGLVRSVALENPGRTLSLVLNGSGGRHTGAARFLAESFGSGVQHVAFRTGDIFASAAALAAAGLPLLPVPDNYYDDLDARFALPDGLLERMRALGVLYDRDADGGEFFQLYTRTFDERFFFEVVERRGYRGFGAANAAVRLAVQGRLSRHPAVPRA